jgi:aminodeoxyfutalosine synthase
VPPFPEIVTPDPDLAEIVSRVARCERLSFDDGLVIERSPDIRAVCELADSMKFRMHGNRIGYIVNVHIDYTNICISGCRFCAYGKSPDSPGGFVLEPSSLPALVPPETDEIHVIGGVNPTLGLDYFIDLLSTLHAAHPHAAIKAFTAVELHALAQRDGRDIHRLLIELKDAGLAMLPGGGAEIFAERVRPRICPAKATAVQWLDVHRAAHEIGIPSNSTMLYGHIESAEDRVDHLLRLRALQDETNGFVAHIPLPYIKAEGTFPDTMPNGVLDLRQIALARLMLDNVPHIKAYWRALGLRTAQVALRAGADDLDGTVIHEQVMEAAGSAAPRALSSDRLRSFIVEAGLDPCRRDSFHRPLEVTS